MNDFHLLALHRIFQGKPRQMTELLASAGSAEAVFRQSETLVISPELENHVESDLHWLTAPDHHVVTPEHDDYPESLREIWDPPNLLFAAGDRSALSWSTERVAMVGARKASAYGLKQAQLISEELAAHQIMVISGMALGIDAAAHEGAIKGGGKTIAVLGTGCDLIYPKRNWRLAERIQSSGLVLSEYPLGTTAYPAHFPRRNRIVTGICRATIVIEAARKSGSLISARLAVSEGREVMALPGLVTNPQASGCHQLIKDGASLIESASDVLAELGLDGESSLRLLPATHQLEPGQKRLMACLEQGPQSIDMLMGDIELSVEELTVNLISLEVLGLVCSDGGRYELTGLGNVES